MSNDKKTDLDAMLADLAGAVRAAAPEPSAALVARVLADAADQAPRAGAGKAARRAVAGGGLGAWLGRWFGDGWAPGAAVAMTVCLALGMALGMGGMVDAMELVPDSEETEITIASAESFGDAAF